MSSTYPTTTTVPQHHSTTAPQHHSLPTQLMRFVEHSRAATTICELKPLLLLLCVIVRQNVCVIVCVWVLCSLWHAEKCSSAIKSLYTLQSTTTHTHTHIHAFTHRQREAYTQPTATTTTYTIQHQCSSSQSISIGHSTHSGPHFACHSKP